MPQYLPRVVDGELDALLTGLSAVAIEGPKGVGKTATALRRARSVIALDDPTQRELLEADPFRLDRAETPLLIDEWQRLPQSWDLVRRSVDRDPSAARFILTGSASPIDAPTHSGAGRIVQLRMRPMSLAERRLSSSTVSLAALLSGSAPSVDGDSDITLSRYADEIVGSGFPAIRTLTGRAQRAQLDGYLARMVERDFMEQDHPVRRPATLYGWLRAYAAATATTSSYNKILSAATPNRDDKPARSTTIAYRDVLTRLWLLDPVAAWIPGRNVLGRLGEAAKHHLADPALAARLLGVDAGALLDGSRGDSSPATVRDGSLLGSLFESLVTLSVRIYAQDSEATIGHLRTRNGDHEVDLVVQRADQRIVALEVKLSPVIHESDVIHLRWLRERLGSELLDAAVITTGPSAYRRRDGIAVIPAALLGP